MEMNIVSHHLVIVSLHITDNHFTWIKYKETFYYGVQLTAFACIVNPAFA